MIVTGMLFSWQWGHQTVWKDLVWFSFCSLILGHLLGGHACENQLLPSCSPESPGSLSRSRWPRVEATADRLRGQR